MLINSFQIKDPGEKRLWLSRLLIYTLISILWAMGYALMAFSLLDHQFPLPLDNRAVSTLVTASDGTPLRAFADKMGIWRYPATTKEVSPLYLEALLNYEDRWFRYHPGINPLAIARAMVQNIRARRIVSGGSTLTMQVARIMAPDENMGANISNKVSSEIEDFRKMGRVAAHVGNIEPKPIRGREGHEKRRSIQGKLHQVFRALQLEWHLTKDEILTRYLTHAPFGSNIEGVLTAAYTWLGKDAKELSHAEAALLAVLPQAPSFYRPDRHPERARRARDKVLDRLEKLNVWPQDIVQAAKEEPVVALRYRPPVIAPLAARRLHFQMPDQPLIRTTLNFDLQLHLEEIVKRYVASLLPKRPHAQSENALQSTPSFDWSSASSSSLSGAALVVDSKRMEIKAYIGSADFQSTAGKGHVDMIQALRSPGSTLKPFLYGAAMDEGLIHSHSLLLDTPRIKADYSPGNFTGAFMGPVSATEALRQSLNVPAVQLLEAYGPHRFFDRLRHAGVQLQFQGKPNLSMILGGVGISLESLVRLYTALVRSGLAGTPLMTATAPASPNRDRYLVSPGAAWIVTRMLRRPLPGFERIHPLTGGLPVAWKTGTSYGFRDAWAMGIMGEFVVGVWVGRPDGTAVPGQYGAVTATPLLERILEALPTSDVRNEMPPMPANVTRESICWPLGRGKNITAPHNCMKSMAAWILDGQVPTTLTEGHLNHASLLKQFWIDANGDRAQPSCGGIRKISVALWPESLSAWLPPRWQKSHRIPKASPHCPEITAIPGNRIEITAISNGSTLSPPPGATTPSAIPLTAMGGNGMIHWFLNGNEVAAMGRGEAGSLPMPRPGRYQLVAADETGNSDMVYFSVIASK